jgi:hypothetical protein
MEEDFVVKVMAVRVEKAKHDDDDDDAITANDASNAVVTTALRLMNMAVGLSTDRKKSCEWFSRSISRAVFGVCLQYTEERRCQ